MKLEELSRILREKDPAAVLVDSPVLARVVQNVTEASWSIWQVPHSHCFVVDRHILYKHVEPDELFLPSDYNPPEAVLLLERPTADQLNDSRSEQLLGRYWRLLFHATAHRELNKRLSGLTPAGLRERIERIGPAAFEEARNVLVQDGLLFDRADDLAAYIEFAAYFLELRFFNPALVPVCFPSLPSSASVEAVLGQDVDGYRLFLQTRLPGAGDPAPKTDDQSDESHDFYFRLVRSARRAASAGDTVAAAILHTRAARVAPASLTGTAQEAARQDIYKLVTRLQKALSLSESEAAAWRSVLPTLLDKADQGARPVEAALLYDLQRACLDAEETIYTLNVGEWLWHRGHKPLKRELKSQRYVRIPAQLRTAAHRLTAARLADAARQALAGLLRDASNRAEEQLREQFRPILTAALHDAGLRPTSLPERAALEKTVEELLDRISSAGFLAFADVRDAIARGQMKLPDLSGANEYVRGDPLLRLDRRLASQLDGVYRRAEPYTRWLERLTAFNFGTETGRWLSWNVTLPFGTAFLIAQFIWLLVYEQHDRGAESRPDFLSGWNARWWFHAGWFLFGTLLLSVIRSGKFRAELVAAGRAVYRVGRLVFWDVPIRVWANPRVREIIASGPFQLALEFIIKPVLLTVVIMLAGVRSNVHVKSHEGVAWGVTYLACAFVIRFPLWRAVEEVLLEVARAVINLVRSAPAVLRWVNDIFRDLVYVVEWVLARAEDWFRLRGRSGPIAVAVRVVAGLVWMPFAFLLRFYTVVLIEPMLNPLKLPLSILFAKFVYPLLAVLGLFTLQPLGSPLVGDLAPFLSQPVAAVLVIGTFYLLPDAFTFLFWEMRENWRLYRANRPTGLKPVPVGPHGETVKGLLHWGFHSGTVPRLFAKLRAAERAASQTDVWRDARTHRAALLRVEESVRRFVTRDLIAVLDDPESGWGSPRLRIGRVTLGTNRIRLELVPEGAGPPAWLEWEDRSGWLVAGWAEPGFLSKLPSDQATVFKDALAYLYKRAGVDVAREQVQAELPRGAKHFDIGPDGLLVWCGTRESQPLLYDLGNPADELRPRLQGSRRPAEGPVLSARRLMFGRTQLSWPQWLDVWRAVRSGGPRPRFGPADYDLILLPLRDESPPPAPSPDGYCPPGLPPLAQTASVPVDADTPGPLDQPMPSSG